jgi:hypothetical protein
VFYQLSPYPTTLGVMQVMATPQVLIDKYSPGIKNFDDVIK